MLRRCIVTAAGRQYVGLFTSTAAAVLDAIERFGVHAATARRLP